MSELTVLLLLTIQSLWLITISDFTNDSQEN